jgi:CRP/FNR family transcriptional regulator, cyclic AMP receptor protein
MKRRRASDYRELLRTGRWFAGLPDELQAELLDVAAIRTASAGERVLARGDEPAGLYAVLDGAVRLSGQSEAGREVLHMVVEPPSWFGELSVIDGLPRTQDATADVASELLHVPQRALEAILAAEPRYWRYLAILMAHKLRLATLALEDVAQVPPRVRLARRLAMMIEGYGDHTHPRRTVELRQEQLAMMLNVSRQTANQLLKELEALGLVKLAYGEVEILDAAALRTLGAM